MPRIVRRNITQIRLYGQHICCPYNRLAGCQSSTQNSCPQGRGYRRAWHAMPLLILWLLVGCIPARDVPPQLSATPAPSYQVTGDSLITEKYALTPPNGWRLIAGPAEDPYTFQFIAPDNTALIVISDRVLTPELLPLPAALGMEREAATAVIQPVIHPDSQRTLYAGYISPPPQAEAIAAELRQLLDTLR